MARRETRACDGCGAEIHPEHVSLNINWQRRLLRYDTVESVIDVEMQELFKEPKDFCNMLCLERWIEALGPAPLP